jgi:hypothetical protein
MANKAPTAQELTDSAPEVAWSIAHVGRHVFVMKLAEQRGHLNEAQAAFDGALLHLRAVVEFLIGKCDVHAGRYDPSWSVPADVQTVGFDPGPLYVDLSMHAAHLSKGRTTYAAPQQADVLLAIDNVVALVRQFLDAWQPTSPDAIAQREDIDQGWLDARLYLSRPVA